MATQQKYFQQEPPSLKGQNFVKLDVNTRKILERYLPKEIFLTIYKDLIIFGDVCGDKAYDLCRRAHIPENYPRLVQYDGWGKRVDEIQVCHEWNALHAIASEAGLISIGYERKLGKYSRLHQYLKCAYFSPVSAIVSCPLAMTDGAVRLIEQVRSEKAQSNNPAYSYPSHLDEVYTHLTSRDPSSFWTSGQWMTEKTGGSDVRQTETVATLLQENEYALNGYKYFTSAITANVTFTLAKIKGSNELSLFFLFIRNEKGELNNIVVHKMKDKMGTKTLPTAELELIGTRAFLVGEAGKGVRTISQLFNVTRLWTVQGSIAAMNYLLAVVRDYAHKRVVFGKLLADQPAHLVTMYRLDIQAKACTQLFIKLSLLLGLDESDERDPEKTKLLRLLTPVAKLFTAKESMHFLQEALESFGAAGYMEDTGLPSILRDQQANTIWEGTSNVISLDTIRALMKDKSISVYWNDVHARVNANAIAELQPCCVEIIKVIDALKSFLASKEFSEYAARDFAYTLARVYCASLFIEHANWSKTSEDIYIANYWCSERSLSYLHQTPKIQEQTLIRNIALSAKL